MGIAWCAALYEVLAELFNGRPAGLSWRARSRSAHPLGARFEGILQRARKGGNFHLKGGNKYRSYYPFPASSPVSERRDLSPAGTTAAADDLEAAGVPLTPQHKPEHIPTHAGASLMQLGRREVAHHLPDGP